MVSDILGRYWCAAGHEVRLVTATKDDESEADFPFEVIRNPSVVELFRLARWSDVVFQNNISLRLLLPSLFASRPIAVTLQTWVRPEGGDFLSGFAKKLALRFCRRFSISKAVAASIEPLKSEIVGNPFRSDIFRVLPGRNREKDLVFVGRLVSDKGVDVLLRALVLLKDRGQTLTLTIAGDGPERQSLERFCRTHGLDDFVEFAGVVRGDDLAVLLNGHRAIVIPSRWAEPFGIVALEGIACGCVAVGSRAGGLGEAIGPCGLLFDNGDEEALAKSLSGLLGDSEEMNSLLERRDAHLSAFRPEAVGERYFKAFAEMTA